MTNPAQALPSGTVTFLFTDIEGSTKLAQQYPDALPALLARHNAFLHQAIAAHNGFVFQIVGDSFSAAFHNASDALNATIGAQRLLYNEAWSPAPIKVRMGIHTGAAQLEIENKENTYSGYATLAMTQRIMSAGHGGQILISQSTFDLIRDQLPENVKLIDMGERRLKDVLRTERLYQLSVPDLPSEFQPLNTLESFNHNLPIQLTSFIGREKEIVEIKKLVAANRMVTLTGSGGAGKTRLSLQVGAECLNQFSDGAWFVELAPVTDPSLVPQTLLSIFSLREDGLRTALEVLIDFMRAKNILLLLDNCEHLIEACAQISESLLRACPKLKIIASSREALGIAGEASYRVPSLSVPSDFRSLGDFRSLVDYDSIRLFIERAMTAKSDFTLTKDNASFVAQICFRLDGIPLAIELAAARVKMLSPEQIASRLDDCFRLLTGGSRTALPRQQTLRALIDWSYSLLSEQEKTLFRRQAVFVGGWTLEAAESVCSEERGGVDILDLLRQLVDKSLVFIEESTGEIRYRRLETIRQYSREKFFETDEVETIRDRHLAFYVKYAESAGEEMRGRARLPWIRGLEAEQDNLRTAMEWGLARNPESALRIAISLPLFWTTSGFSAEGFRSIQQALEHMEKTGAPAQPLLRAKGLGGLSFLYMSLGDNTNGKRVAEESLALFRQSQDKSGLAYALFILAFSLEFLGERLQAEAALLESIAIARSEKNSFVLASALNNLTRVTLQLHGDIDAAERYADEAIRISHEAGVEWNVSVAHEMKGLISLHRKDYDGARTLFEKAINAYRETGASFNVIIAKSSLAHMERELGNYVIAQDLYRETITAFRDVAQTGAVAHQLECFGFLALTQNQNKRSSPADERALQLFAAANALREKGGTVMTPDEQVYFDEQLRGLRDKLDPKRYESTWSTGRNLSMEQAVQMALQRTTEKA